MWDLIVLIPDHCLSVYFRKAAWSSAGNELTFYDFRLCCLALYAVFIFSTTPTPTTTTTTLKSWCLRQLVRFLIVAFSSSLPRSFQALIKFYINHRFFCVSSKLYVSFALLLLQHESRLLTPSSHLRYQKCIAVFRVSLPYLCFRNLAVFILQVASSLQGSNQIQLHTSKCPVTAVLLNHKFYHMTTV